MTHLHLRVDVSDTEWIQRSLQGAQSDPVGLWQMVKAGRYGFGLTGSTLEAFVRQFIEKIVAAGADPVIGGKMYRSGWSRTNRYGTEPVAIASALISEWNASGVDPDVAGVWFAFPSVWKGVGTES